MKNYDEYVAAVSAGVAEFIQGLTDRFLVEHLEYTREDFLPLVPELKWPDVVPAPKDMVVPESVVEFEDITEDTVEEDTESTEKEPTATGTYFSEEE